MEGGKGGKGRKGEGGRSGRDRGRREFGRWEGERRVERERENMGEQRATIHTVRRQKLGTSGTEVRCRKVSCC